MIMTIISDDPLNKGEKLNEGESSRKKAKAEDKKDCESKFNKHHFVKFHNYDNTIIYVYRHKSHFCKQHS